MSTNKFEYWPNTDGNLGSIKVQIPTNVEDWPEGDALIDNFVYKEGELVDLVDTKALVPNDSKSTTIPYDCVDINLPSIYEWGLTVHPGPRCKYLNIKWNQPDAALLNKYKGCKTVSDIKAVDANYKNDIANGVWFIPLSDMVETSNMFSMIGTLTEFYGDLSSLEDGTGMFYACTKLRTFKSNLTNLKSAAQMFAYAKLDTASVQNIAETIGLPKNDGDKRFDIGLANSPRTEEDIAALDLIASKGWNIFISGRPYTPSAAS